MSKTGRGGSPSSGFIRAGLSSDLYINRPGNGNGRDNNSEEQADMREVSAARFPNGPLVDNPSDNEVADGDDNEEASSSLMVVRDLKKSGLNPRDMLVRVLGDPERAACGISHRGEGYAIPYFEPSGAPIPFYRSRILNADFATNGIKYKQPRNTPNHIYFPKDFRPLLSKYVRETPSSQRLLIITEGEKKATCSLKWTGLPSIALSGVESWRSRTLQLPGGTEIYSTQKNEGNDQSRRGPIIAKLPSSDVSIPELLNLAKGFGDLLDLIKQYDLKPILIYDSDNLGTLKAEVQRAATMLAYELVFLGIHAHQIKQVILPALPFSQEELKSMQEGGGEGSQQKKCGLDDYLMAYGPSPLLQLIQTAMNDPKAFPRHPNPKGFISTQLQANRLSRKAMQQVASMVLTELDASGRRFKSKANHEPFYYDSDTHHLLPALRAEPNGRLKVPEAFGTLLYQKFGISKMADYKVLEWLEAQFLGEEPIEEVQPKRIISLITEQEDSLNPFGLAIQASDSQFFAVSPSDAEPVRLLDNGQKGILFEQGHVEPLDVDLVLEHLDHQLAEARENDYHLEPWWSDVIEESNIGLDLSSNQDSEQAENGFNYVVTDHGRAMRQYASLLFYISPFLLRWRGLQLPVELTIGSAGSGKSSLYSLRLQILTGRSKLRNIPTDVRDFQSSLANSGGLHVTDNVNFANKELRQIISDELCRITTERIPEISTRKYYTNTEEIRIPVHCTFAFTALSLPFHNEDLLQRAVTFHTKNVGREPKGDWFEEKLNERGGREAWFAHHLAFLHLFLRTPFEDVFHTQYRLAHLEQCMSIASRVLNVSFSAPEEVSSSRGTPHGPRPPDPTQGTPLEAEKTPHAPNSLSDVIKQSQQHQMVEGDWVMRGISTYVDIIKSSRDYSKRILASDITDYCLAHEEFSDNEILINPRRLGRYMQDKAIQLYQMVGIKLGGTYANRAYFLLVPPDQGGENHG